jgi:hypothetical protein
MMEEYFLSVRWKNRAMTAEQYLAFSKGLLQELMQFDPVFSNLFSWGQGPNQKAWFAQNYSDLDDKVFPQLNDEEIRYENPDSDNWKLTLDAKSFIGFTMSYSNTDKLEEGQLTVRINAGATTDSMNVVGIEFPTVNYPQFYEYDFVSALMKVVVEYCQPQHGYVISHPFWEAVELEDSPIGTCPIGWLTYLADEKVKTLLPSDVEYEVLTTGGTLITLKHSPPSAENEADIARAIRIRDAVMPLLLGE